MPDLIQSLNDIGSMCPDQDAARAAYDAVNEIERLRAATSPLLKLARLVVAEAPMDATAYREISLDEIRRAIALAEGVSDGT